MLDNWLRTEVVQGRGSNPSKGEVSLDFWAQRSPIPRAEIPGQKGVAKIGLEV